MISKDQHFKILHETETLIVGNIYEDIYLVDKTCRKEIHLGGYYGDPACGIISYNNDWCLVGGVSLIIWRKDGIITEFKDEQVAWVSAVRQTGPFSAEFLIDPWSEFAAIWSLNIQTLKIKKLKSLPPRTDSYLEKYIW